MLRTFDTRFAVAAHDRVNGMGEAAKVVKKVRDVTELLPHRERLMRFASAMSHEKGPPRYCYVANA